MSVASFLWFAPVFLAGALLLENVMICVALRKYYITVTVFVVFGLVTQKKIELRGTNFFVRYGTTYMMDGGFQQGITVFVKLAPSRNKESVR